MEATRGGSFCSAGRGEGIDSASAEESENAKLTGRANENRGRGRYLCSRRTPFQAAKGRGGCRRSGCGGDAHRPAVRGGNDDKAGLPEVRWMMGPWRWETAEGKYGAGVQDGRGCR
ncbi:hypothetical protein HPP92_009682 [Vanilla planifolia]|uniref:Uncharacterized protein n=1 Tax=Vanilla planifolia TaxID=51239 RepID=A0A835RKD7_VANPL|nr:hypothetical protein HPP92_009682 [Vanilla planifolia]